MPLLWRVVPAVIVVVVLVASTEKPLFNDWVVWLLVEGSKCALLALVGSLALSTVATLVLAHLARMQWVKGQRVLQLRQVYCCGHFTAGHEEARRQWLSSFEKEKGLDMEKELDIKASTPPFNVRDNPPPEYMESINLPAFGPNISREVMKIFDSEEMKQVSRELNVPITSVKLSSFVQKKMSKVHDMIRHARGEDLSINEGANRAAIDKMEAFVTAFESLTPESVKNSDEWSAFMHEHVEPGWENRIDFEVLLGNFGFEKDAADALRKKEMQDDGKTKTLEDYACRWLGKAFTGYAPEGALVDVVNLAFAMSGRPIPTKEDGKVDLTDVQIANEIKRVREKVASKRLFGLWIPSKLIMDAEVDDNLCWIWLESIHRAQGTMLNVLVQLPADPKLDGVAQSMERVHGCRVWKDPGSRNLEAVSNAYGKNWPIGPVIQASGKEEPLLGPKRDGLRYDHKGWLKQLCKNPEVFVGEDGGWYAGTQWPLIAVAFVDESVLKLQRKKEREKKGSNIKQSWCLGPVVPWVVWLPAVYAVIGMAFVCIGACAITLKGAQPSLPHWWLCLVMLCGLALYACELRVVRLQAAWYRLTAESWKCFPVEQFLKLLQGWEELLKRWDKRSDKEKRLDPGDNWVSRNREWMTFEMWFLYLSGLSWVRLWAFFQANTFLGTILFWPERGQIECVWKNVMSHAMLLPQFDITYIIIFILFMEVVHFLVYFGYSCPRRYGHHPDPSKKHTRPHGKPFDKGFQTEVSAEPRHAYVCLFGIEVTSAKVVDSIGEACGSSFLMDMNDIELSRTEDAENALKEAKEIIDSSERGNRSDEEQRKIDNAAFEVRGQLASARSILRASFSRTFLQGVCFSGLQTHFQVTFFNVLRLVIGLSTIPHSMYLGIFSQVITMFLLVLKLNRISRFILKVTGIINNYKSTIVPHVDEKHKNVLDANEGHTRRIYILVVLNVFAAAGFFLVIVVWLVPKFVMETFVCEKHMWNWAPSIDPRAGCVPHPLGSC